MITKFKVILWSTVDPSARGARYKWGLSFCLFVGVTLRLFGFIEYSVIAEIDQVLTDPLYFEEETTPQKRRAQSKKAG